MNTFFFKLFIALFNLTDGKLYDAYVSYLHGDDHTVSSATTFTLRVLPEVLEDRFGYKLFISDRDAYPGTGTATVFDLEIALMFAFVPLTNTVIC